jgi:hypothetical protein
MRVVRQRRVPRVAQRQTRLPVGLEQQHDEALALGDAVSPELRRIRALWLYCGIHGWCFLFFCWPNRGMSGYVENKKPPPGSSGGFFGNLFSADLEELPSTAGVVAYGDGGNRDYARYRMLGCHGNKGFHSVSDAGYLHHTRRRDKAKNTICEKL